MSAQFALIAEIGVLEPYHQYAFDDVRNIIKSYFVHLYINQKFIEYQGERVDERGVLICHHSLVSLLFVMDLLARQTHRELIMYSTLLIYRRDVCHFIDKIHLSYGYTSRYYENADLIIMHKIIDP